MKKMFPRSLFPIQLPSRENKFFFSKLSGYFYKSTACGANVRLHLLIENSRSKKGHNYVKNNLSYLPYWYGFPFDGTQLV